MKKFFSNLFGKVLGFEEGGYVDEEIHNWLRRKGTAASLYGPNNFYDRHPDLYDCNHHHPMTDYQEMVDFGTGPFVADKRLIPLLKSLNEAGLMTRTHNHAPEEGHAFVSIILTDAMQWEVRKVIERDSNRDTFTGETELLIMWTSEKLKET